MKYTNWPTDKLVSRRDTLVKRIPTVREWLAAERRVACLNHKEIMELEKLEANLVSQLHQLNSVLFAR